MPPEARIFLAEDFPPRSEVVKELLEDAGHQVLLEAKSLEEGLSLISKAIKGGINVAVLDDGMPEEDDGEQLAKLLREGIPGIKIVSISSRKVGYVDVYAGKEQLEDVGKIVTSL
jgi:CheY-like chemotaxis protein